MAPTSTATRIALLSVLLLFGPQTAVAEGNEPQDEHAVATTTTEAPAGEAIEDEPTGDPVTEQHRVSLKQLRELSKDVLVQLCFNLYDRVHDLEQADTGELLQELEQLKEKVHSLETTITDMRETLYKANREIVQLGDQGPSAAKSTGMIDVKPGDATSTDEEGEKRTVVFTSVEQILKLIPAYTRPKATGKRESINTIKLDQWASKNLVGQHFEGIANVAYVQPWGKRIRLTCSQKQIMWHHFKTRSQIQAVFPEEQSDVLSDLKDDQYIAIRGEITSVRFHASRNWFTATVVLRNAEIKPR
jgi:flagellar motility protein MotE (MotC chaperone)